MKRKVLVGFVVILFLATTYSIYADEQTKPATSGLVDTLSKNLSLKPEQATGAAGSVFSLAKSKMSATDFTKLASGYPEMDTLLKATPKTESTGSSALTSALSSQSGAVALASQFKTLGISPETGAKIVPEVLNFVKAKQGDAMMGLLSKAVK